jgi:hypothetical protein
LLYGSEDGIGGTAVVDSNGIFSGFKITDYFFGHWKYITSVGQNGLFFYNYVDELANGVAKTALLDGSGNFTWRDYIAGFGQWTHVVGCPNGTLLFYNLHGGIAATATVDDLGNYDFVREIDLPAGWTNIAAVGAGSLIFYNAETTDGAGATATIDDDGVFTPVENNLTNLGVQGPRPEPWTDVVGLPNGCVFFYSTTRPPPSGPLPW